MTKNLFQSDQMEHVAALSEIGVSGNTALDTLFPNINSRLLEPGQISVTGTSLIATIGPTVVTIGPSGKKKSLPPVNKVDVGSISGTVNLATGVGTGQFTTFTPPSITSGYSIWVGFEVRSDKTINAVFGVEGNSPSTAVAPIFTSNAAALGMIILTHDGVTPGWGNFNFPSMASIKQFGSGSGTGSGSGSGGASKAPADGFQAIVSDTFDVAATDAASKVNATLTTATYSASKQLYAMACDRGKTVTITGTTATMSSAPSFTVTPGCILWVNSLAKWAKISAVGSPTSYTLDYAIGNVTTAACMVAQAVWSKDLVNIGSIAQSTRLKDYFSYTSNTSAHIKYTDSDVAADDVADLTQPARAVAVISNEGFQDDTGIPASDKFGSIFTRPIGVAPYLNYSLPDNTFKQRCFVGFFPNPNNSINLVNLLDYDLSLYAETTLQNGGYLKSAFCLSDGSGTEYQCSAPAVVSGNTQITLSWDYVGGINPGSPDGDLEVKLDGMTLPRFFSGCGAPLYWKEISSNIIEINGNLTILSPVVGIHISKRQGSIDTSVAKDLQFAGTTLDASPKTIAEIAIPNNTSIGLCVRMAARENGTIANAYVMEYLAENDSGTVTVTQVLKTQSEDDSDWDATVTASGANALIRVTGEAAKTITWTGTVTKSSY